MTGSWPGDHVMGIMFNVLLIAITALLIIVLVIACGLAIGFGLQLLGAALGVKQ